MAVNPLSFGSRFKHVPCVRAGLAAKRSGRDGCYVGSCFVHQQSIGACWAQKDGAYPNCVGWTSKSALGDGLVPAPAVAMRTGCERLKPFAFSWLGG